VGREEVGAFVRKIKSPLAFIENCKKYHEEERRDIAYVIAWEVVHRKPQNIHHILAGSKLMIITWNAVGFGRLPKRVKQGLESEIIDSYNRCRSELDNLSPKRLVELDDSEIKIAGEVFQEFSSKRSIGSTGASKVLHILNPDVFMMWDNNIRKAYHVLHNEKKHGIKECYIEFLKQSKEIVQAILKEETEDRLWERHLTFLDKEFIQAFSFHETALKMLDECNYVKFTKRLDS
jgi:hypothetical protein